ncbi:MAG: ROK family transcriptional regulator [Ignavibacteriae bacterium]|nr:ROK family transcriptional regulator [Ignavibacteriota bacterium]
MSKVLKKNKIRRNLILRALLDNGPMSLSELKEKTGITLPVVSSLVKSIKKKDLVVDIIQEGNVGVGRPPSLIKLNGKAGYVLGIDLDRIYSKFILLDLEHNIIADVDKKQSFLSNDFSVLEKLKKEIDDILTQNKIKWETLLGIGISIPGFVDTFKGTTKTYLNFNEKPIRDILQDYFKKPVHIEHDVKALALGELWFGSAKNQKNALCLKVDWGVGLGIIIDGKVYYGNDSFAGEFGHIQVVPKNGALCYCGKRGCLETVASGRSIIINTIERLKKGETSLLSELYKNDIDSIDARAIIKAAIEGDQFSLEIIEDVAKYLGFASAMLVNIFNPSCIILGGNIASTAPQNFVETIKSNTQKYSHSQLNRNLEFVVSNLGFKAGALGVAMLVAKELFEIEHLNPSAYV